MVLAMILTMLPASAFAANTTDVVADNSSAIYFDNTAGWTKVFAYASNDDGYNKTWPGVLMTQGEDGYWYAEIDSAYTNIIFNNNSSASTQNLTIPTDGKNLFTYSTNRWTIYAPCDHDWGEGVETVVPTCTTGGTKVYTCAKCGDVKTETLDALGHVMAGDVCLRCSGTVKVIYFSTMGYWDEIKVSFQNTEYQSVGERGIPMTHVKGDVYKITAPMGAWRVSFSCKDTTGEHSDISYSDIIPTDARNLYNPYKTWCTYAEGAVIVSGETKTIYFHNTNDSWSDIWCFAAAAGGHPLTDLIPGAQMTKIGWRFYSVTIPVEASMVIFNDGSTSPFQTELLTLPNDGSNLYDPETGVWSKCDVSDGVINNECELALATRLGGNYIFGNDVSVTDGDPTNEIACDQDVTTVIDLAGHTLDFQGYGIDLIVYAGSVTIMGGVMQHVVPWVWGGTLTLQDVQIVHHAGVRMHGGTMNLYNVTTAATKWGLHSGGGTLNVYSGTYSTNETQELVLQEDSGQVILYGGAYSQDVSAFVAEGYECIQSGDMWIVQPEGPSAEASIKFQTKTNGDSADLRLVTWVDSLDYAQVYFNVTIGGRTAAIPCTTVYSAINANGMVLDDASAVFGEEARYFVTYTIKNIPSSAYNEEIQVSVTWTDLDGHSVTSETRTIVLADAL